MATVQEVWRAALPGNSELRAGSSGLHRSVREVILLKPRSPGLPPAVDDELILLSVRTLAALDMDISLASALASLASRASSVAVQGPVSPEAEAVANAHAMPLFQLPDGEPLSDIENTVIAFLAAERDAWYRRRHSMLHDLAALAVQGDGLPAIARHMGDATSAAVLFSDDRGETLAEYVPGQWDTVQKAAFARAVSGDGLLSPWGRSALRAAHLEQFAIPVVVRDQRVGLVALVSTGMTDDLRAVLEAGATAGAIELARADAVRETVHRIQGDLMADILLRPALDRDLDQRTRRAGHDLTLPRAAIILSPARAEVERNFPLHALLRRLPRVFATQDVVAPVYVEGYSIAVFYPFRNGATPNLVKRTAARLRQECADLLEAHDIAIGIGCAHVGLEGIRKSYREGRQALELARSLDPQRDDVYFGDLGVFRLLLTLREGAELQEFFEETIGTLAAHDREARTDFVRTAEAYISSRNATEAARALSVHRNTLLYRLRRMREVSDLDLDDPETRLAVHLALRISQVLGTREGM